MEEKNTQFRIKNAEFVTSVANSNKLYKTQAVEIAIAGRSNVGKSSFINFLTNNKKLAKTSGDPGRTRLLNYFSINKGEFFFVDLPGYGYAKAPKTEQEKWGKMIEGYLTTGPNLKNVFVLVDSRHEPSNNDKMMVNFLHSYNIDFTVIATKSDKLNRSQMQKTKKMIATALRMAPANIYLTSALKKTGKEEILRKIEQIYENNKDDVVFEEDEIVADNE